MDEKVGLRRDAVRPQVIDALKSTDGGLCHWKKRNGLPLTENDLLGIFFSGERQK